MPGIGLFGSMWGYYRDKFRDKHGSDRYYWENLPFWGSVNRVRQGAKQAQDYYDNTGRDDYYQTRYADGSLGAALGSIAAPIPGVRLPTMAKSLAKMYGAEIGLDVSFRAKKKRRH